MTESENSTKMERFQVYLCEADAKTLKWLAYHHKPESESNILKRCILNNTTLTEMAREVFHRKNAEKNCPILESQE